MTTVRWLATAIVSAMLFTGCGGGASAPAAPKAAAPAASAPAPAAPAPAAEKPAPPAAAPATQPAAAEKPAAAAPSGERKQLTMGTTQTSSSHYAYYVAVAKVINAQVPDVNVTAVETGAAVENINRMGQGTLHLGLVTADTIYRAVKAIDPWAGDKAVPDLRVLVVYDVNAENFIVREDSGIRKLEDLGGRDYNPGIRGSATENRTRSVFQTLGITPKFYVGGTDDALAAIKDKRIVGYTKASAGTNVDASILELMTATPIRVLSFSKEQVDKVLEKHPYFSAAQVPAGTYKAEWNAEPILTMGSVVLTSARVKTITDDQAYKMTKAIIDDNRPGGAGVQAAAYPSVKGKDLAKLTVDYASTPLHAGAQKYYTEIGIQVPEKLRSPEAK